MPKSSNDLYGMDSPESDVNNFDYENTNLNKLSLDIIQKHKDFMEKDFQKNSILPGDEAYIYDKQVSLYYI